MIIFHPLTIVIGWRIDPALTCPNMMLENGLFRLLIVFVYTFHLYSAEEIGSFHAFGFAQPFYDSRMNINTTRLKCPVLGSLFECVEQSLPANEKDRGQVSVRGEEG